MSSDDWIRERALRERARDEEQRTQADTAKRRQEEHVQTVRNQLPPLWAELVEHLKRKVDLYNNDRGTKALTLTSRGVDEDHKFIELSKSDSARMTVYSITADLSLGSLVSRVTTGGAGGRGEGSGNVMMGAENGTVRFGVVGTGHLGTEELADWLVRHVLDR